MTGGPLADKIARRIRAEGPLSVAAYMAMALYDPELGYYTTRQPIGSGGDFITAPEISQIFGELIGLWCALMWQRLGCPDRVILAELGPGSGTLAADLLRGAAVVPEFRRALQLHLIEISPILRAEQQRRLAAADPIWLERADDLPVGPLLVVSNEFLDALPIRQLVRGVRHWAERMVALDPAGRFAFVDGPESPLLSLLVPQALRDTVTFWLGVRDLPAGSGIGGGAWRVAEVPAGCGFVCRLRPVSEHRRGKPARGAAPPAGRRARSAGQRRSQRRCRFCRLCRGRRRGRCGGARSGAARRVFATAGGGAEA